jgi:hypothetical protein
MNYLLLALKAIFFLGMQAGQSLADFSARVKAARPSVETMRLSEHERAASPI